MEKVEKTDGPWTPFWSKFVYFGFVFFLLFVVSPSTNQKLYRTGPKIEENNLNLHPTVFAGLRRRVQLLRGRRGHWDSSVRELQRRVRPRREGRRPAPRLRGPKKHPKPDKKHPTY